MNIPKDLNIKAFALDLDGTLTDSQKNITSRTKRAIHDAINKGITIILASGRPSRGMFHVAQELELESRGGYILAYNGGEIINCKTHQVVFKELLPKKFYKDICDTAKEQGLMPLTYTNDFILTENKKDDYVLKEQICTNMDIQEVANLGTDIKDEVVKFLAVGEPEKANKAIDFLREKFSSDLNIFFSEPYFIEITPLGIDKAAGIRRLCDSLDIKMKEVCAMGDGMNDIPMLEQAGFSVVMDNSSDRIKKLGNYVTKSNDEDGVAYFIENYLAMLQL